MQVEKTADQLFTADDIYNANDLTLHYVKVPEWGEGKVLAVRGLSGDELIQFQSLTKDKETKPQAFIYMFAASAVNEKGERLFKDEEAVTRLKKKSAAAFLRVQDTLLKINGMSRADKSWKTLKAILEGADVDQKVIDAVQAKWQTPEDEVKND